MVTLELYLLIVRLDVEIVRSDLTRIKRRAANDIFTRSEEHFCHRVTRTVAARIAHFLKNDVNCLLFDKGEELKPNANFEQIWNNS